MVFVKNFKPYVVYLTELLNLVINLTRYELNRIDKQLTTYINTKSKSSKYESNIGKAQNLITKWKNKELFFMEIPLQGQILVENYYWKSS